MTARIDDARAAELAKHMLTLPTWQIAPVSVGEIRALLADRAEMETERDSLITASQEVGEKGAELRAHPTPSPTDAPASDTRALATGQDSRLLLCPFCGRRNVAQGSSRGFISVWCNCGARGPEVPFPDTCDPVPRIQECYALWNKRHVSPIPDTDRKLARAVEALEKLRPLSECATPGPWSQWGENAARFTAPGEKGPIGNVGGWEHPRKKDDGRGDQRFIVAMENFVRSALADLTTAPAEAETIGEGINAVVEKQPFERFPRLAASIAHLGFYAKGISLQDWNEHLALINAALAARETAPDIKPIVEALARSDAAYDGRPFDGLGRSDKRRYLDRSAAGIAALDAYRKSQEG